MKKFFIAFLFLTSFSAFAEDLPKILSDEDAASYAEIFKLQAAEKIDAAKKLDAKITDQILMSDVLCQRYISKTYRTKGAEVADWTFKYSTRPCAERMFALSKIKRAEARAPRLPNTIYGSFDSGANSESWTAKKYSGEMDKKIAEFRKALRRGSTLNARNILEDKKFKEKIASEDYGRLAGRLGYVYYTNGETHLAHVWSDIAAGAKSEYGLWTMGLLSFKEGDFSRAQKYFADIIELDQINAARKQEAAFWAGRAASENDDRKTARKFWKSAAKRPQTFYGALASASLGDTPNYEFYETDMTRQDVAELMKTKYGMAALASLQIGKKDLAEAYLRLLITSSASDELLHAVHTLAATSELPRTAMQVAGVVRERGILEIDPDVIAGAQYPLPDWEPMGGWSLDRALLFAITRQESGFKNAAKSRAGANGVMQLMPGTAKLVARKNNLKMSDIDISNPNHNMFLGQQYIVDLLELPNVENNIIKMLISYNAGNGTMNKWGKKFKTDDPLLYIESFPAAETRNYVKRVLSNMWLYKARLGQPLGSIDDLANGKWLYYESEDDYVRQQVSDRLSI